MAGLPPPEGMTEDDYDAIHAAVVETVRGRWFLAEFARRSRVDEVQEMLSAIGRLEAAVTGQRAALPPPVDTPPHMRLLVQRADDIASRLAGIIEDLRESGADDYLCDELETQVRAISGLHKAQPEAAPDSATPGLATPGLASQSLASPSLTSPGLAEQKPASGSASPAWPSPQPGLIQPVPVPPLRPILPATPLGGGMAGTTSESRAPALAALAAIDRLSLAEKLALFA